jgi:hypothetical protein
LCNYIVIDPDGMKDLLKKYMEKLLNEENAWDEIVDREIKEGPCPRITEKEVFKAVNEMKRAKIVVEAVGVRKNRLRWFRYVERKDEDD